jgi:hypothetical protein
MFIVRIPDSRRPQYPPQVLLMESYREPGAARTKVKHRTLLNLTHHAPEEVAALEFALKHKHELPRLEAALGAEVKQGRSVGAVWLLREAAQRVGLAKALGGSREGKLSLWLILARLIDQGSRLSAVRLAESHAASEALGLEGFDEDNLYTAMDWLDARQGRIEQSLFRSRHAESPPELYLYDVTSSYLEGERNAYGAYGYNRDRKRGKRQIVVGLLLDGAGDPVSVEVFAGNTQDVLTVESQVRKLADRFGAKGITLVGDRGMLKSAQLEELSAEGFHYLTAITKPQIETLLKSGALQLGMFDEKLCEVLVDLSAEGPAKVEGVRYLLRKNPQRAAELWASREDKFRCAQVRAAKRNAYVAEHPRAKVETGLRDLLAYTKKLRIDGWSRVRVEGRTLVLERDDEALALESRLDGCYALKTDVPGAAADAETLHARYKDLTEVERAFRVMKTVHLEVRPVYVQKAERTRAHVFIVMLALLLRRELERAWRHLDLTVEEGINALATLCAHEVVLPNAAGYLTIPQPRDDLQALFSALKVSPPTHLPRRLESVVTKAKLPPRRKKA